MDLQDFRIFVRLAATRNLSQVGTEFGLTPGTISKRLQALEDEIKARLFDRTTRSIHITEEGKNFLKYAERVLENVDLAVQSVASVTGAPRGRLKLSASTGLGKRLVVPLITEFMRLYPDVDIQVAINNHTGSLLNEGVDIAIRNKFTADNNDFSRELGIDPQVLVAAPAYLKARGTPATPADLSAHDCLYIGDGSVWTFDTPTGEHAVRVHTRVQSNSAAVIHEMALEGRGIFRQAEMRVRHDIEQGRLVPVLTEFPIKTDATLYAIYPRTRHMTPRLRAFVDFVVEWFRKPDGWQRVANTETPAGKKRRGRNPRRPAQRLGSEQH